MTLKIEAIEEAAQFLSHGKGDVVLTGARKVLSEIEWAVKTILGESSDVIKRTSKSTGTERLSFGIGKINITPIHQRAYVSAEEVDATRYILDKANEVSQYLTSRGVNVETVDLGTKQAGIARHSVDVILNENVLGFRIGKQTSSIVTGGGKLSPV